MPAAPKLLLVYTQDEDLNRVQQNTAEAFRHLAGSFGQADIIDITFTAVDPGAAVPLPVKFQIPSGLTLRGVEVINSLNVTSPSLVTFDAITAPVSTQSGTTVSVAYFTGLTYGAVYKLTLRVTYA